MLEVLYMVGAAVGTGAIGAYSIKSFIDATGNPFKSQRGHKTLKASPTGAQDYKTIIAKATIVSDTVEKTFTKAHKKSVASNYRTITKVVTDFGPRLESIELYEVEQLANALFDMNDNLCQLQTGKVKIDGVMVEKHYLVRLRKIAKRLRAIHKAQYKQQERYQTGDTFRYVDTVLDKEKSSLDL